MIRDWLVVGFVFAVLWVFWLWLGAVFDAISEYHRALKRDAAKSMTARNRQPQRGKGSSA